MSWGLVLLGMAVVIGWRRARVDRFAVGLLFVGIVLTLAYAYRGMGGG
jgi:hypothetical protein